MPGLSVRLRWVRTSGPVSLACGRGNAVAAGLQATVTGSLAPSAPTITSPSFLVAGTVNTLYPTTYFTATGSTPITWTSTALPAGMTFTTVNNQGVLAGTPTATSSGSITFTATNALGSDGRALTLTVNAASSFASPVNIIPPTIETVISGATINQVGTMLRVKRGGWPATQGWTLDWGDAAAAYANPGIAITNGSTANPVKFALSRRYQWLRNGVAIPKQNGITYTITSADVGQTISVQETVNRVVPNVNNTEFVESATTVSVTSTQTVTGITGTQAANLVYENNLTYLGSFRPHNAYFDTPSIDNLGTAKALAFDATGNGGSGSLWCVGGAGGFTSEFSIPGTISDGFLVSYNALPEAPLLQTPKAVFDWALQAYPSDPVVVSGQLIYNGKLIQSAGVLYTQTAPLKTHGARSKVLSVVESSQTSLVTPSGGYGNGRYLSGPMCLIPPEWQTALGGKALTGWAGVSVNSNANKGPPAYAFDPDLVGTGGVTAQTLLYYSNATPLDAESQNPLNGEDASGSQAALWTSASFGYGVFGMSIPNGTDSLLYFGPHPVGVQSYNDTAGYEITGIDAYYGGGARNSFDPKQRTRGPFATTYVAQCWAYDLNDLAAVKNGSLLPYNVKPYAVWSFSIPYASASNANSDLSRLTISGSAYDPATKRLFIAHHNTLDNGRPLVISVFNVSNAV